MQNEPMEFHTTIEKNGGRLEKRTAYVSNNIDWLDNREVWKNLSLIGAIHREFEKDGKYSSEWHYYISSAPLTAEALLRHAGWNGALRQCTGCLMCAFLRIKQGFGT